MSVNVMLAGVGFFPHTVAGDKNFWIRMTPLLQERGARLAALSVNDRTGVTEMPGGMKLFNMRRSFHLGSPKRFYSDKGGGTDYKHKHHRAVDSLELLLTAARNLRSIRRIVKSEGVQVIHFMDNMGPAMRFLKRALPEVRFSNSQLRYNGGRAYDSYIRGSMLGLDATVAYSGSCRQDLVRAGIPAIQTTVIRWGVKPSEREPDPELVKSVRGKLGVADGENLIVWSGFIMHIQKPEFEAGIAAAKEIAAARTDCRFIFSFKPLCFDAQFKQFETERVQVVGDLDDFQGALAAADFYYSPATKANVSVAPPLTWIEAMNYGTPVITTRGSGVEEVIEDGRTGYLADSISDMSKAVDAAIAAPDRAEVRSNCRSFVRERFNINKAADEYVELWESLMRVSRGSRE